LIDIVLVHNHLTKDKNGMLHRIFAGDGKSPFSVNLPTDSAEEPQNEAILGDNYLGRFVMVKPGIKTTFNRGGF